jgi:mannose-6-phosphate isomerase-like protein (cupin superfamily)
MKRLLPQTPYSKPNVVHPKSWGEEVWVENCPEYCGKVLRVHRGKHTSMHFHIKKLETMYVVTGLLRIDLIDPETTDKYAITLEPGQWVQIPRGQPHSLHGETDVELMEFSTTHEDSDSYRVSR